MYEMSLYTPTYWAVKANNIQKWLTRYKFSIYLKYIIYIKHNSIKYSTINRGILQQIVGQRL